MSNRKAFLSILLATPLVCVTLAGCGPSVPPNLPVTVVVKNASGEPMNMVKVKFIPQAEGLDGTYVATGITDDEGVCSPTVPGNSKGAGVPACKHKVLFGEAPVSSEARAAQERGDQSIARKERKSRRHRPIPRKYIRLLSSPVEVEVSEDNLEFELSLD